ncbi:MAG: LytR C-terminal domain-containing protein [Actinomycetota bacterium]|nr:LytR C-terminal domain-containing protein [Actinomycetota bacterium]
MSNDNQGRTARTTSGAPMGSTVAIVVTAIALILGFLILRKVNDSSTSPPDKTTATTTQTTVDPTATTEPPAIVTTTTLALIVSGTQLQVANASNQDGVAKQMSTVLATKGFTMAEPVSATVTPKLEVSEVLYNASDTAAKPMADSLAAYLGIESKAQGLPVPVQSGAWAEGSGVILMLGNDFAGKTLDEILGVPTTGTTTPPTTT